MELNLELSSSTARAITGCARRALVTAVIIVAISVMGAVVTIAYALRVSSGSVEASAVSWAVYWVALAVPALFLLQSSLALINRGAVDPELLLKGVKKLRTYFAVVVALLALFVLKGVGTVVWATVLTYKTFQ